MGLLDAFNTDEGRFGLGLLAAAAPRADAAGFGQRLMEGVGSVDQWKQQQSKQKMYDLQMQEAQMSMAQKLAEAKQLAELRAAAQKNFIPAKPAGSVGMGAGLDQNILPEGLRMPTQVSPMSAPSGFNNQGYMNDLYAAGMPDKAIAWQQSIQKDNTPISVGAGDTLVDKHTLMPIFSAPQKPVKDDSKIAQFEYAVKNGYKGTFDQFVSIGPALMAAAQAPLRTAQTANIYAENDYNLPPAKQSGFSATVEGKTFRFPTQSALNSFKMKAGVK